MKTKRNIVIAAVAVAFGTLLVLTQVAWFDPHHEPFQLDGSWLARIPGTPWSWFYTITPSNPGGRAGVLLGTMPVGDPTRGGAFPTAEYETMLIGTFAMTNPNEAAFTTVSYGMKKGVPFPERVWIEVDSGVIKKTGPGQTEVSHNDSYFLPSQDADGDGLPDKDQMPVACAPFKSVDKRLPLLAPCKP